MPNISQSHDTTYATEKGKFQGLRASCCILSSESRNWTKASEGSCKLLWCCGARDRAPWPGCPAWWWPAWWRPGWWCPWPVRCPPPASRPLGPWTPPPVMGSMPPPSPPWWPDRSGGPCMSYPCICWSIIIHVTLYRSIYYFFYSFIKKKIFK